MKILYIFIIMNLFVSCKEKPELFFTDNIDFSKGKLLLVHEYQEKNKIYYNIIKDVKLVKKILTKIKIFDDYCNYTTCGNSITLFNNGVAIDSLSYNRIDNTSAHSSFVGILTR